MSYTQKDIVKIKGPIRDGIDTHPVLIISNESSISAEKDRRFVGLMLTHSDYKDRFTFQLKPEMIDGPWKDEWSQVRTHILVSFPESVIKGLLGKLKKPAFKAIIDLMNDRVFSVD